MINIDWGSCTFHDFSTINIGLACGRVDLKHDFFVNAITERDIEHVDLWQISIEEAIFFYDASTINIGLAYGRVDLSISFSQML